MDPVPSSMTLTLHAPHPDRTAALARHLAGVARAGDVIALEGDLGAGKTTFARAFVRAYLDRPDEDVPSPTFTLAQIYEPDTDGPHTAPVWHVDLYRLAGPEEAVELGIEDAFAEAVTLIEWPDRLAGLLPEDRLVVRLTPGPGEADRTIALTPGPGWRDRLASLAVDAADAP